MPPVIGNDGTPSGFTPPGPFGVWGDSGSPTSGNGVIGSSHADSGVAGFTAAKSNRAAGVFGNGPVVGVAGAVLGAISAPPGSVGVYGTASNGLGGTGVQGDSDTGVGVSGNSSSSFGIFGRSSSNAGVVGVSDNDIGVAGISSGGDIGVFAAGNPAGLFSGDVLVSGNLRVTGSVSKGGGGFAIDHPLDPANQYLRHSFVESPDMKNLYDGIAVCDTNGEAIVDLPAWFAVLNADFRYQLTPICAPSPNLFIAGEISNQRFRIGGGTLGLKVSWQVTGVRQDAWAKANRIVTEEPKAENDKGRYLHPEAYGRPPELAMDFPRLGAIQEALKKERKEKQP
jgi:hypothetical protein